MACLGIQGNFAKLYIGSIEKMFLKSNYQNEILLKEYEDTVQEFKDDKNWAENPDFIEKLKNVFIQLEKEVKNEK